MEVFLSVLIGPLGCIPLLLVLWKQKQNRRLKTSGEITSGIVEDIAERRNRQGQLYYHALIQYEVYGKGLYRGYYVFNIARKEKYFPGRKLSVVYDKNKPERFLPRDAPESIVALILAIIMAVLFLTFSFLLYNLVKKPG